MYAPFLITGPCLYKKSKESLLKLCSNALRDSTHFKFDAPTHACKRARTHAQYYAVYVESMPLNLIPLLTSPPTFRCSSDLLPQPPHGATPNLFHCLQAAYLACMHELRRALGLPQTRTPVSTVKRKLFLFVLLPVAC
jgi:hypothetical protein